MKPLVTVITICWNAEDLIGPTMLSVLNQSYQDIEYIIVDGLSSDKTLDIVYSLRNQYPQRQITVISERDKGITDAMNKGVQLASGKIIAHLHAGDTYIDETIIDKVVDSYEKLGWRWAVAPSIVVDGHGNMEHVYHPQPNYRSLLRKNSIPHQSTFLLKEIFDQHGLFRLEMTYAMDYEYWLRIAFKGGERYHILPWPTTYFLNGGHSSGTVKLLKYSLRLRRELHTWVKDVSLFDDAIFFSRVALFPLYMKLKSRMKKSKTSSINVKADPQSVD